MKYDIRTGAYKYKFIMINKPFKGSQNESKRFTPFRFRKFRFRKFRFRKVNMQSYKSRTYTNVMFLRNWLDCRGKIVPRRKKPGIKAKQQKRVTRLIKHARINAFIPYIQTKKWRKRRRKKK